MTTQTEPSDKKMYNNPYAKIADLESRNESLRLAHSAMLEKIAELEEGWKNEVTMLMKTLSKHVKKEADLETEVVNKTQGIAAMQVKINELERQLADKHERVCNKCGTKPKGFTACFDCYNAAIAEAKGMEDKPIISRGGNSKQEITGTSPERENLGTSEPAKSAKPEEENAMCECKRQRIASGYSINIITPHDNVGWGLCRLCAEEYENNDFSQGKVIQKPYNNVTDTSAKPARSEELEIIHALLTKRWEQLLINMPELAKSILRMDATKVAEQNHFHDSKEEIENTIKLVINRQLSDTFPNAGCWHERTTWQDRYDNGIRYCEAVKRLEALQTTHSEQAQVNALNLTEVNDKAQPVKVNEEQINKIMEKMYHVMAYRAKSRREYMIDALKSAGICLSDESQTPDASHPTVEVKE